MISAYNQDFELHYFLLMVRRSRERKETHRTITEYMRINSRLNRQQNIKKYLNKKLISLNQGR